ncbi:hypothetical protein HY612_00775 [Candidatus Roizmanbacteria bacterium]|nr:hypothetical protein [Candidatus Roizmanbacteria bacterium]
MLRIRRFFSSRRSTESSRQSPPFDTRNGKMWLVQKPIEGPAGPYDDISFYGDLRRLQVEIPPPKRWNGYQLGDGRNVGARLATVTESMHEITRLVARVGPTPQTPDDQLLYQQTIMPVFNACTRELLQFLERNRLLQTENIAIMAPLNGGEFTAAALVYNARKLGWNIPLKSIPRFELKRVTMEDGSMYVGERIYYLPSMDPDTVIIVADDCIATYVSADRSIRIARKNQGLPSDEKPKRLPPPIIMVAAGNQAGIMELEQHHKAVPFVGKVNYALDRSYYLRRTPEEGYPNRDYTVGSMGDYLARLPDGYDQYAPWNSVRKELVSFWESL